jgi:hypothetical protein
MFSKGKPAPPSGSGSGDGPMGRKEAAVWLGRALSTDELTLKLLLQLLDVVAFQQGVIQDLAQKAGSQSTNGKPSEAMKAMDAGAGKRILQELNDLRGQIKPVLDAVEKSCTQLEKMI